jgi:predicted nuclease with TOPRIM domain
MIKKFLKSINSLYKNSYSTESKNRKELTEINDCLYDYVKQIKDKVEELEARCENLEQENVSLTNELYRMENSLDSRIDIVWLEFQKVRSSEP